MARQTKKYVSACKLLGINPQIGVPHEAIYGMLALRDYVWDGSKWQLESKGKQHSASIRISADESHLPGLGSIIEDLLISMGCDVRPAKGPYQNRTGKQSRIYINFTYKE